MRAELVIESTFTPSSFATPGAMHADATFPMLVALSDCRVRSQSQQRDSIPNRVDASKFAILRTRYHRQSQLTQISARLVACACVDAARVQIWQPIYIPHACVLQVVYSSGTSLQTYTPMCAILLRANYRSMPRRSFHHNATASHFARLFHDQNTIMYDYRRWIIYCTNS